MIKNAKPFNITLTSLIIIFNSTVSAYMANGFSGYGIQKMERLFIRTGMPLHLVVIRR
jgi:hypothetical protein